MDRNGDTDGGNGFKSLKDGSTDSAAVAAYYDDWAGTYDATLKDWAYRAPADAAAALYRVLRPGAEILDVGCGTGLFGQALSAGLDCRIEGIDISAASLDIARDRGVYARLHRHDLQTTPLPPVGNAFDAAACVGVMTYIEDPAALLADLCRIVRPGGHILFTQRDDRWAEKGFDALVAGLAARRLWTPLTISEPKPYLPENEEFGDSIRAIHVLCRVI